ncbi:hypothetical protein DUNSADRAFT_13415, partial [Dunaliella salina]
MGSTPVIPLHGAHVNTASHGQVQGGAAAFLASSVVKKWALGAALTVPVLAVVLGLTPVYIESSQSSKPDVLPATFATNAPTMMPPSPPVLPPPQPLSPSSLRLVPPFSSPPLSPSPPPTPPSTSAMLITPVPPPPSPSKTSLSPLPPPLPPPTPL